MSFLTKASSADAVALRETSDRIVVFKKAALKILDEYDLDGDLLRLQDMIRGLYAGAERGSAEPSSG